MLNKKIIGIGVMVILAGGISVSAATSGKWKKPDTQKEEKKEMAAPLSLPFEIAAGDGLTQLSDANASWPGELVSPTTIEAHPQSEGTIVELNVRVGQKVSRGEILARLSPPPASVERADAASEKMQMLIRARANASATARLVEKSRIQFLEAKKSLIPARDAAISLNQKDADRTAYLNESSAIQLEKMQKEKDAAVDLATKEYDQAVSNALLKERNLRVMLQQTIEKNIQKITWLSNPDITQLYKGFNFQFKPTVGSLHSQTLYSYQATLGTALKDLQKNPSPTLDESALAYVQSFKSLVYASASSDEITIKDLEDWKMNAREAQTDITDAANEKRESENMVYVKKSELAKMIAERDKEITDASINTSQARISSESNEITRKKGSIDSELEYQNRNREIDVKLIELNRELELAKAEVKAAEAAYQTFVGELSSQVVTAQRAGIVSGIFKSAGDYVTPEVVVATIGQEDTSDAFIRFRIPSDSVIPEVGSEVSVIRPSFPFDKKTAIVVGVGGTLGGSGVFTAEAEFSDIVDWPVHALVRVMPSETNNKILIPFTALRWDENNQSHIYVAVADGKVADRIIKTGKAVGDRIEILEGLVLKQQYLARPIPENILKDILIEGPGEDVIMKPTNTDNEVDQKDPTMGGMEGHGDN